MSTFDYLHTYTIIFVLSPIPPLSVFHCYSRFF